MRLSLLFFISLIFLTIYARAAEITFQAEENDVVEVCVNGGLFTKYVPLAGNFPMLFPLLSATGERMTRDFPMIQGTENESEDHPHHRSLWLTHGNVGGVNFWNEGEKQGKIVHRKFLKTEAPTLAAAHDWLDVKENIICTDICVMTFGGDETSRWIDFRWKITAGEKDVIFGDTKEGTFALRVAGTMDVTRNLGGEIVSSEGYKNDDAWGKRASWVNYHGPVGEKTLGITIMNHPASDFYPTYWHVRTYGLFAANPFGVHDFLGSSDKKLGDFRLEAGKTMTLLYRVYIHPGDEKTGNVAEVFRVYAEKTNNEIP